LARTYRDRIEWRTKDCFRKYLSIPYSERRLLPRPEVEGDWKVHWSRKPGRGRFVKRQTAKRERQRAKGHGARRIMKHRVRDKGW
jgi:hypothetical protein